METKNATKQTKKTDNLMAKSFKMYALRNIDPQNFKLEGEKTLKF